MFDKLQQGPRYGWLWLFLIVALFPYSSAISVHVNYTSQDLADQQTPEQLIVTVVRDSGAATELNLTRAAYGAPNVPVCTLNRDKDGKYVCQQEKLPDNQNIGFYQDLSNEAVIQVTKTEGLKDKKSLLVLNGELMIEGQKYTLSPDKRVKRDVSSAHTEGESYNLVPQDRPSVTGNDYLIPPPEEDKKFEETSRIELPAYIFSPGSPSQTSNPPSPPASTSSPPLKRSRRQSQTKQKIITDLVAVVDFAIYKRFLNDHGTRDATIQAIRVYFSFIVSGVDMRYQNMKNTNYDIHVRLIKIIIAESASTSEFTEPFSQPGERWREADAESVLTAFSNFAVNSGLDAITPYDHAMLFTGYDLTSTYSNGAVSDSTTGLAYTSTMCRSDGKSVSVVEDLGGFQCVDTAAHELGHSYSAGHDGEGNNCRSEDRYIMSSGGWRATESNKLNSYIFSSCSINSITNFITNRLRSSSSRICLTEQLTSSGITDVSNRLPGLEVSADAQCRMIYGNSSRLCRGTEFGPASGICTSMFCYDPSTSGTCYERRAARGTTCGNGKMCLNGECIPDSRAPAVDEDCLFGDQPGIAFNGQTCAEFIGRYSGYCYQEPVRNRCCGSCKKALRNVAGCEYGDTVQGCSSDYCRFGSTTTMQQCCGTCNYGSAAAAASGISNSAQVPASSSWGSGITSRPRSRPRRPTAAVIPRSSPSCIDKPYVTVNGVSCSAAVAQSRFICYTQSVKDACCLSCSRANSGSVILG